jgi:hypothetical protein
VISRIRRIRRVQTPLEFRVEQITNAYRVHEPVHGWGVAAVRLRHSLQSLVEEPLWRSVSIAEQANEPEQRELWAKVGDGIRR